jgi:drug/metabolite transporter (DMT)-like permease
VTRDGRRVGLIVLALAAVYFIWGSTYLGIRFGLEGFPPLLMTGLRFLIAGTFLYAFLRWRGVPPPTRAQWWNLTRIGALLLIGGVGLVSVAEDLGIGSGVTATAVAVMPLWAALFSGLFGSWPGRIEWIGLVVGFAGVLVLSQEGDFQASTAGTVLVLLAPLLWAFGSVWSRHLDLPGTAMTTAGEMLAGGALLTVAGLGLGERIVEPPSTTAWLALAYLVVFGSLIAFSAFSYLIRTVKPTLATSYAYVNPIVAVILGVTLGDELLAGPVYVAMPLILLGVVLVVAGQRTEDTASVEKTALGEPAVEPA